jgi:recombination DNA repair RAD52 pathway protein
MAFTESQVRALTRKLSSSKIRTKRENGRELSYIEGWHAIAEANRIFGFEGWDRETVETRCIAPLANTADSCRRSIWPACASPSGLATAL